MNEPRLFPRDTDAETIAEAIERDGYAIVRDMLDAEGLARLRGQLRPLIDATPSDTGGFMGARTVRFGALLGRCEEPRSMALDPLLLAVVERVLGPYCARFQLNYTGVMHLKPGETAQPLHRDASFYPFQNPGPPTLLATMWAVTDFTRDNGATWLVPGSHLWDDDRVPTEADVVQAVMPAGAMLLYNGNVHHAGGANRSNGPRTGCALQFSLGWLRQEENQYMAVPQEIARTFPRRLQELMGYDLATVNCGFVDHKHPNDVLNGTAGDAPGDLGPDWLYKADSEIRKMKVTGYRPFARPRHHLDTDLVQGG